MERVVMNTMKKAAGVILFSMMTLACISAAVLNDTQVLQTGHHIYDDISTLYTMSGMVCPASSFPATVGELKFLLNRIDPSCLDEAGKSVYEETWNFLHTGSDKAGRLFYGEDADSDAFRFDASVTMTPEACFKTDSDIPWIFSRTTPYYQGHFLNAPLMAGFGDSVTMEADFFLGKTLSRTQLPGLWQVNIPYDSHDFFLPRYAYGSTGFFKDNWGMSFHIANDGLTIGRSLTGSIIYNSTFETQSYAELKFFSDRFNYALDVSQITDRRFMYLHHLDIRPINQLKVSFIEGGLVNGPLEIKYLNPFMVVHNWYPNSTDYSKYQNSGANDADRLYCAYMGIMIDWTPVKNVRIYALWAQNEMQAGGEPLYYPDSCGLQLGTEAFVAGNGGRLWKIGAEALYTLPYLYIKQSQQSSLYTERAVYNATATPSWIGTPYGPDCFAVKLEAVCSLTGKWSAGFGYSMSMKGEIDSGIFTDKRYEVTDSEGNSWYAYYPSVWNNFHTDEVEKQIPEKRHHLLTGVLEVRHDFSLSGQYNLNERYSFAGQLTYSLLFNRNHESGSTGNCAELDLSVKLKFF